MEPLLEKPPSRFSSFFKTDFFKKKVLTPVTHVETAPPVVSPLELEQQKTEQTIHHFIETRNLKGLDLLIEEEIPFSKRSLSTFLRSYEDGFEEKKYPQFNPTKIDKLVKTHAAQFSELIVESVGRINFLFTNPQHMVQKLGYTTANHNTYEDVYHFMNLSKVINAHGTELLKDKDTIKELYDMSSNIYNHYYTKSPLQQTLSNNRQHRWVEENRSFIMRHCLPRELYHAINVFMSKLGEMYTQSYEKELIEQAKNAKNTQYNQIQNLVSNNVSQKVLSLDFNTLPGQDIIKQIHELSGDLKGSNMNTQQQLNFDNLHNKRMPQIIEEYITIPERYRKMLDNNKDTPEELFLSSMTEIKNKLESMMIEVNDVSVNNLKKSNRYLKTS